MSGVVAVVGTVNHDRIVARDGSRRESLGGILYNVITLAALLEGTGLTVRAHGRLGEAHRAEAAKLLGRLPGADAGGLISDPAGTNVSVLDYSGPGERVERVEMLVAPLSIEDLRGATGARAVLVNMISGRDLAPETVAELRRRCPAALFLLDVQALARTSETPRRPRAVPDWRVWCAPFDVVRGNEEEIAHFPGGAGDVTDGVERLLEAGVGEVLVTRGERGALRAVRESGVIRVEEIPAFPAGPVADPTGCGDAFLSGVCAGRVLGLSGLESVRLGSWIAGRVATLSGLESLLTLRGVRGEAATEVGGLRGRRDAAPRRAGRQPEGPGGYR